MDRDGPRSQGTSPFYWQGMKSPTAPKTPIFLLLPLRVVGITRLVAYGHGRVEIAARRGQTFLTLSDSFFPGLGSDTRRSSEGD